MFSNDVSLILTYPGIATSIIQTHFLCLLVCLSTVVVVIIFPFSSSSSNSNNRKEEGSTPSETSMSPVPRAPSTSDSVRMKCREMLAAALKTGGKSSITMFAFFCSIYFPSLAIFNAKWDFLLNTTQL